MHPPSSATKVGLLLAMLVISAACLVFSMVSFAAARNEESRERELLVKAQQEDSDRRHREELERQRAERRAQEDERMRQQKLREDQEREEGHAREQQEEQARQRAQREAAERRREEEERRARLKEIKDQQARAEQSKKEIKEEEGRQLKEQAEHDHEQILAYMKVHVPSTVPLKGIYWSPPEPATSKDGQQKGLLYHLQGRRRLLNPNNKYEAVVQNYYFFVVNGDVLAHERNDQGVKFLKICNVGGK